MGDLKHFQNSLILNVYIESLAILASADSIEFIESIGCSGSKATEESLE